MATSTVLEAPPQVQPARKSPCFSARHVPELDGLRGLAVLMVLIRHCVYETHVLGRSPWISAPLELSSLTWSGVDLFFVLSGFLLGGILLDNRESPNYFSTFYVRRALRILPVYAVLVGAYYFCIYLERQEWIPATRWLFGADIPWYSYLTFTQNFQWAAGGPNGANWMTATWSLAVEEQFYLVLPAMLWFLSGRKLYYALGGVVLAAPLLRLYLVTHFRSGQMASFCLMPCRADALLLGVTAAVLLRNPKAWEGLKEQRRWLAFAWVVLLAGLPAFVYFKQADPILSFWMTTIGFSWMAFFYLGLLLMGLIFADGPLGKMLRNRWLKALGTISYGVYLIHKPVLGMVFDYHHRKWPVADTATERWMVLAALGITFAIASLSWTYFEKPLLKIGRNLKY